MMTGDPPWPQEPMDPSDMSDKLWWMLVVGECKRLGINEWFYADREAWLEQKHNHNESPNEAIQTNIDACM